MLPAHLSLQIKHPLLQGVKFLSDCEFIAIFDADFKPEPDFLLRTAPYLVGNADVGYVQTRWVFTNPEESYLTKVRGLEQIWCGGWRGETSLFHSGLASTHWICF